MSGPITREMQAAITRMQTENIPFHCPSPHQLKVGPFNFYPKKGTIYIDGEVERSSMKGIDHFVAMIKGLKR